MIYLGNKAPIVSVISRILKKNGLMETDLSFFDAFCGTGSVSESIKKHFHIIVNDILTYRCSGNNAYVERPGLDQQINICKGFFSRGSSHKAAILIHELIHRCGYIADHHSWIEKIKSPCRNS